MKLGILDTSHEGGSCTFDAAIRPSCYGAALAFKASLPSAVGEYNLAYTEVYAVS